jgi:superfamily I DNA/RNA helicase
MSFEPTQQQKEIVAEALKLEGLKIVAYAGAGKSSTLKLIAEALEGKKGLYLSFNKALAEEAKEKFPSSVACMTTHSLAFRAIKPRLAPSTKDFLDTHITPRIPKKHKAPSQLAWCTYHTIMKFCNSGDKEVTRDHTYNAYCHENLVELLISEGRDEEDIDELRVEVVKLANTVWARIGNNMITHDVYLKLFELVMSGTEIDCDYVLFDEAQDSNGVSLSIVKKFNKPTFVVGDPNQQIYEWRGSVDAMEEFGGQVKLLSKSFRFGPKVASLATRILKLDHEIEGSDVADEIVFEGPTTKEVEAVIGRTNRSVFDAAVALKQEGIAVRFPGAAALKRDFEDLCAFLKGKRKTFKGFSNPKEFINQLERDPLVIDSGWMIQYLSCQEQFKSALDSMAGARKGVFCTTAHKAKGLEWDTVKVLASSWKSASEGEVMRLMYVAVTRAKKKLIIDLPETEFNALL